MNAFTTPALSPEGRHWSSTLGIVLIVAGILAIILPVIAGVALTALLGWVLLLAGVAHLVYAWGARGAAGSGVWQGVIGLLYLLVALYLIFHPARGLVTLTLLLAIYFVVEGVFALILFFRLRRTHRAGVFLWDGLITLLLGLIIWAHWPLSSAWAIGTIVGISLLMSGIARLRFHPHRPLIHLPGTLPGTL
jgi:uncharacterized membrane protein HdeD (DUF308 family)